MELKFVIKYLRFIYSTNVYCILPWTRPLLGSEDVIVNKTETVLPSDTLKSVEERDFNN